MRVRLTTIGVFALSAVACGGDAPAGEEAGYQFAVVEQPDGWVDLYSGWHVADMIARGEDPAGPQNQTMFQRLRVPRDMVDEARSSPQKRRMISLEEPAFGVEFLVREADLRVRDISKNTPLVDSVFYPGEPWLSGLAEVFVRDDRPPFANVHIIKHSGTLPSSDRDSSFGFPSCAPEEPDCPRLRYDHPDPCRWPTPLPAGWTLVALMGQTTDLDVLCGRK